MKHSGHQRTIRDTKVTPKKSLGQNFLVDQNLARWIADQIEPDHADIVMEIGPGLGALTDHLTGRPRRLILVEKDTQLAGALKERFADRDDVRLLQEDAARIDLRPYYKYGGLRIIGNLPYSMGGEIMKRVLTPPTPVTRAVFMLQKEVCDRLCAKLGADAYGGLSLLVQKDWDVKLLRVVPPDVFKPKPKVDSAVVCFTPRAPGSLSVFDRSWFDRLVRMGFSQRRKQLKNLLPDAPAGWSALVEKLGVTPTVRAEELSLAQWVDVARWYEQRHETDRGQKATEMFDVVNDLNEITGQRPRGEVHAQDLRHRAVHVFVFNKHGEVYLQKRSHLKDVHPLVWDSSAAGHLEVGESYATCALREVKEELGVEVAETHKVADVPATERTGWEFVEVHSAHHNGPMRYAPDEIETGEWFTPAQVIEWINARPQDFASGFIECWHAWEERHGTP
jgi:16S rRNA (adenine1518-N6/adenine1519-N6)-dimethyltransferase